MNSTITKPYIDWISGDPKRTLIFETMTFTHSFSKVMKIQNLTLRYVFGDLAKTHRFGTKLIELCYF